MGRWWAGLVLFASAICLPAAEGFKSADDTGLSKDLFLKERCRRLSGKFFPKDRRCVYLTNETSRDVDVASGICEALAPSKVVPRLVKIDDNHIPEAIEELLGELEPATVAWVGGRRLGRRAGWNLGDFRWTDPWTGNTNAINFLPKGWRWERSSKGNCVGARRHADGQLVLRPTSCFKPRRALCEFLPDQDTSHRKDSFNTLRSSRISCFKR